jgi:hypothetical protein
MAEFSLLLPREWTLIGLAPRFANDSIRTQMLRVWTVVESASIAA